VQSPVSALEKRMDTRWLGTAARFVIGAVFAFSGFTKIVDIDGTIRSVRAYQLLPEAIVPTIGAGLPVLELALAALLLAGLLTRVAAVITVPLSLAFFLGVASAWARGLTIECGCFGNGGLTAHPVPGYVRELVLNAALMAAAAHLIRYPVSRWSLDDVLGLRAVDPVAGHPDDDQIHLDDEPHQVDDEPHDVDADRPDPPNPRAPSNGVQK
jgi:uncharacterized membrane protein YphA (DoxX/SURF4 family)